MENVLSMFNKALKDIANTKDQYLKELTPKQRIAYTKFESELATLTRNGDYIGIEKLKEKFKTEFND